VTAATTGRTTDPNVPFADGPLSPGGRWPIMSLARGVVPVPWVLSIIGSGEGTPALPVGTVRGFDQGWFVQRGRGAATLHRVSAPSVVSLRDSTAAW
jgi:hypothetical protein